VVIFNIRVGRNAQPQQTPPRSLRPLLPAGWETHSSAKLLLARCIAAVPEVTIHMDGKEMT
jgi:hypothetical protein